MTTMTTIAVDRDAFAERLFRAAIATQELFGVYLGDQLGLYGILAEEAALTPHQLAERAAIHPRYAREWLEQQAVAGVLVATGTDDEERRFALPAAHRQVLAEPDNPAYAAPFAAMLAAIGGVLPALVDAYRTGGGVPWEAYGPDMRAGQAAINRPTFVHELTQKWLPAVPGLHQRLLGAPPARVADVGCGGGWSAIAIARAYPQVIVDGFDLDGDALAQARTAAESAGVADRVTFTVGDAATLRSTRPYDVVCIFEALHDFAHPVAVLRAVRSMLAPGGAVVVADERVAEEFTAPGDEIERMTYGWSILLCLPTVMGEDGTSATGTVLRPATLAGYAGEAGFSTVEVVAVDNDFFRLYRLAG